MKTIINIGLASTLALATAMPAVAQQYRPTPEYQRQQEVYDAQRSQYEDQRAQYEERREDYREARRDSREARRDYDRRLAEWNRAQGIYDRRYGYGAYARMYPRPVWDQTYWSNNEPPPYAGSYGRNTSNTAVPCNTNGGSGSGNTVAGGVIGALAGAVLGSQVASRGARTEGAVLGGVAGAVIGGAVGNASQNNNNNRSYKCDSRGPYFSYNDTVAYREGRNRYASSYDATYYERQRCRLAAAPVDAYGRDVRYVRVCPDDQDRYRITG